MDSCFLRKDIFWLYICFLTPEVGYQKTYLGKKSKESGLVIHVQVERIMANHFKVKDGFKFDTIYVKTIKIEPKPLSTAVRRRLKSLLEEKLEKMYDRKFLLVFDGMETLYSNEEFPFQTQEGIVVNYGDPNRFDHDLIIYFECCRHRSNLDCVELIK